MPASYKIDNKARLLIILWYGEATDFGLIEAIIKYQREIQCLPAYNDYNEVFNFSQVTDINLTTKGIKIIAEVASRTDPVDIIKKLALIVRTNKAFFLARTCTAYRSLPRKNNKEIRIFTKESEAFDWVKTNT